MDKNQQRYSGLTVNWAHGRIQWANDALNHIEQHGLIPGDRRPYTMAIDLPAIRYVLGDLADGHPTVIRIKEALKKWNLDANAISEQFHNK